VAAVAALALLFSLPFVMQLQADSYKALYDGRWIVAHGIPHHEALTLMARGRSWIDEQWLSEVAYYGAWKLGGDGLVALVTLGAVALAYMILAWLTSTRGARLSVAVGSATVGVVSLSGWQFPRAQDLVLPLFATLLAICITDSRRAAPSVRLVWLLPLLVLWANLHGSVLLGAAMASAYLLYRAIGSARAGLGRQPVVCAGLGLAALLTPLATPYGLRIIDYYREFTGNPAMARMAAEWAPPSLGSLAFFELCLPAILTLAALGLAARRRSWPPAVVMGAAGITAVAGVIESGSIVWFGMSAAVLLAEVSRARKSGSEAELRVAVPLVVAAAAVCALVIVKFAARPDESYESMVHPQVTATTAAYAAKRPCASVLADNLSASALLWHAPQLAGRLAFDSRLEQYAPSDLARFATYQDGRGGHWAATTQGFTVLVGESTYARGLVGRLERLPGASVLSRDDDSIAVLNHGGSVRAADCLTSAGASR
jgi:hypothetical protein